MKTYHKIRTLFKRDPANNHKTLLVGEYSAPEFEYLKDNEWVFTEKVDGTNIRVMWTGESREFRGKSDNAQIPATLLKVSEDLFPPEKFRAIPEFITEDMSPVQVCLYGEGYGPKIQKGGGKYGAEQSFVLFDVKVGPWWLERSAVMDVAQKLGIEAVPIIMRGSLGELVTLVSNGFTSKWGNFDAEGIVARPAVPLFARNGARIITKLKHKDFS